MLFQVFCANFLLKACLIILPRLYARNSEVTHFELTIVVDEEISAVLDLKSVYLNFITFQQLQTFSENIGDKIS